MTIKIQSSVGKTLPKPYSSERTVSVVFVTHPTRDSTGRTRPLNVYHFCPCKKNKRILVDRTDFVHRYGRGTVTESLVWVRVFVGNR